MLDHSLVRLRQQHEQQQCPQPVSAADRGAGRGCGRIKGGQHINFAEHTPLANLLLTLLNRAGMPIDKVGDSTGPVAEI